MNTLTVYCPCGGHAVSLSPDMPPVGGRASFTCPACGERRTFVRTREGVVFDGPPSPSPLHAPAARPKTPPQTRPETATTPATPTPTPKKQPAKPPVPAAAPAIPPSPVPPDARVALTSLTGSAWTAGLAATFPGPEWAVLPATYPAQALTDLRAHNPRVVLLDESPVATALAGEIAALPGRNRSRITVLLVGPFAEGDALAAFARSADAVLDGRNDVDIADRLEAALTRAARLPALFTES